MRTKQRLTRMPNSVRRWRTYLTSSSTGPVLHIASTGWSTLMATSLLSESLQSLWMAPTRSLKQRGHRQLAMLVVFAWRP